MQPAVFNPPRVYAQTRPARRVRLPEGLRPDAPRRRVLGRCTLTLTAACTLLLASCAQPHSSALEQIRARGKLRVVTLDSPTSYYLSAHGPQGFEYRLASAFAHQLGVQLEVEAVLDEAAMRAALAQDRADIAAAQITADADWRRVGLATHSYEQVAQLVVQVRGKPHPRDVTELCGTRVVVRAASPQLAQLRAIRHRGVPRLLWSVEWNSDADPLEQLESGKADYAVVDANEFAFTQHLYPDASVAFSLPDPRPLQWVVRADGVDLVTAVDRFFAAAASSGELARIQQQADGEASAFDYVEAHRFRFDIAALLPQLQPLFQEAAVETGLDWRLLAAVGYQESKWQMDAVSSDGARGVMMLTSDAANAVGITHREDVSENILGGARYLAQVINTIPKHVPEPDRTWLALAAYNVGYGHLEDARVLTQHLGKNPDSWDDVRAQLPLLAQAPWYARLKRGYARGSEPTQFVQQVRRYLEVLEWLDSSTWSLHAPQRVLRAALATPQRYD
jgi:membrane-bound lytic murein transglycosylase F